VIHHLGFCSTSVSDKLCEFGQVIPPLWGFTSCSVIRSMIFFLSSPIHDFYSF
jgi:hypothetical protein